ncbi:MAG: hypothetical protein U0X20_12235 [Caldilineaceae bacterium]
MSRNTILRFARPASLQAILEGIVDCTNAHQGPNRPQVTTLRPVVADVIELPVYAQIPADGALGLIFCEACCPTLAPGEPPLILCLRPVPGHGAEHAGIFSGAVAVSVWQHPDYPLSPKEVEWLIARNCGCENHEWSQLPLCWRKLNEMVDDDLKDLVAQYEAGIGSPASDPPNVPADTESIDSVLGKGKEKETRKSNILHRGSGEPRKASTFYLLDLMRSLPSDRLYDFQPFFPGWLCVYQDTEGFTPNYPDDLFRQAALACVERILRERGEK